jgi:hypothetical protein
MTQQFDQTQPHAIGRRAIDDVNPSERFDMAALDPDRSAIGHTVSHGTDRPDRRDDAEPGQAFQCRIHRRQTRRVETVVVGQQNMSQ